MNEFKRKYIDLILNTGVALKKGQSLMIKCEIASYDFARNVAIQAYKNGALNVEINVEDYLLESSRMKDQTLEEYSVIPEYIEGKAKSLEKEKWAFLRIDGTENKHLLEDSDPDKASKRSSLLRKANKAYHQALSTNQIQWCVICVPGINWAKKVLGEQATEEQLWQIIGKILHLDKNPAEEWAKETKNFEDRMNHLNSLKIKSLNFKNSKTDLTIGFRQNSKWVGGPSYLPDGHSFYPNLPTAEIFSTPDSNLIDGYVTTTKPVAVFGTITEEVKFYFKNGKVVDFTAKKGEKAIEKLLDTDEGSRSLGEVALVEQTNEIAKSNLLFGSILYDENASCHIAIGDCYPECFEGEILTDKEKIKANGGNVSDTHLDFMIGSDDMNIFATLYSGEEIQIFKQGCFNF